ncbi:MAG: cupin domain-containing protein [Desulfobacterales bacterium]|nr:cupin domain-containing protein [Desulfobacterales bacterium]
MSRAECQPVEIKGGVSKPLLNAADGYVAGFCSGISFYTAADYPELGTHDDCEGFFVMEGEGRAKVGDEEYRLDRDVCFWMPAGVQHAIKRGPRFEFVKVCWFHASITERIRRLEYRCVPI